LFFVRTSSTRTALRLAGLVFNGTLALLGVLAFEARHAHRAINSVNPPPPPDSTGWHGEGLPGKPVVLALLGDSSAAGYGLADVVETPGTVLASGLAERAERPVHLLDLTVVGAVSGELDNQVDQALTRQADLAVILVGANDVVRLVPPSRAVRHLVHAVHRLQAGGVKVLVGTCPDLGTIQPILPPLRQVCRVWSRRIAAQQTIEVVRAGARTVSLADILGPEFVAQRGVFFGPDQFHPSAVGYAALADVLLPSSLAALGLLDDVEAEMETYRGGTVMPIAAATFRAVNHSGVELDPAPKPRGRLGRLWVRVLRRR